MEFIKGLAKSFRGAPKQPKVNYDKVRQDLKDMMDDPDWDDGSYAPIFIRLAWHSSGTFDKDSGTGGSNGATMRHEVEANDPENAGLDAARAALEPIKAKHPGISYSDLWILAAYVAIEVTGGPVIPFTKGRKDKTAEHAIKPGNLPQAEFGLEDGLDEEGRILGWEKLAAHIREVFGRMGFNDREIVALITGGHVYGRCHPEKTGYAGAWVEAPTVFTNEYAADMFEDEWMYVDENTKVNGVLVPEETRPTNGKRQYMSKWEPVKEEDLQPADPALYPVGRYKVKEDQKVHLRRTHQTDSYIVHEYEEGEELNIVAVRKLRNGVRGQVDTGGWVSIVETTGEEVHLERIGDLKLDLEEPVTFRLLQTVTPEQVKVYSKPEEGAVTEAVPEREIQVQELVSVENEVFAKVGENQFYKIVDKDVGALYEKVVKGFNDTPLKPLRKLKVKYQMMLPSDMVMLWDEDFAKVLKEYANDVEILKKDFGAAYKKLTELGVPGCPVAH